MIVGGGREGERHLFISRSRRFNGACKTIDILTELTETVQPIRTVLMDLVGRTNMVALDSADPSTQAAGRCKHERTPSPPKIVGGPFDVRGHRMFDEERAI